MVAQNMEGTNEGPTVTIKLSQSKIQIVNTSFSKELRIPPIVSLYAFTHTKNILFRISPWNSQITTSLLFEITH